MGMFDSVWLRCPQCGAEVEFQSKAGHCALSDYTIANAPPGVAADIIGDSAACTSCGRVVTVAGSVAIHAE